MRKLFTPEELLERLEAEAARSVRNARERHCHGDLPDAYVFTLDERTLCDAAAVVAVLLRDDGWHRPDVRIGPLAMTADAVVLTVSYPDEWSDVLLEGEYAFPVEPFILVGPALPPDVGPDQPDPRVVLPDWSDFGS